MSTRPEPADHATYFEALHAAARRHAFRYAGSFIPGIITRAQGPYIYDEHGREIIDFTSGQMCSTVGHNHPEVVEAIEAACRTVIHLHSNQLSPPVIELMEALGAIVPRNLQKIVLLNTGSESNEAALRMAKLVTGGFEVLALSGSWHGMTAGASASTYAFGRRGYGPTMPGVTAIPTPNCYRCPIRHCRTKCDKTCLEAGFELADKQSVGAAAAFLFEPLVSAGGVVELPGGYMTRLRELCDERGLLIVADEAQTGMGRLGTLFGFQQDADFAPDFLTLSKTLGGGLPLAATLTSEEIEETCFARGFVYGTSHVSDPLPAIVGLAIVRMIIREKLAQKAAAVGAYMKERLLDLKARYECVGDVRGRGLLLGVEIVGDRETRQPDPVLGTRVMARCYELGLSMNIVRVASVGSVFRIAPPLTITNELVDRGVGIMDQALSDCLRDSRIGASGQYAD